MPASFPADFDYEVEAYHVCRKLRRCGVLFSDAEDLAQDVFLVMWRRWRHYDPLRPLRSWLAGIAYNVARDYLRRGVREIVDGLVDLADEAPGADQHLSSRRVRALAHKALARLPEMESSLLVRHDMEGVPMHEITRDLRIPLFTGYSRLRRARRSFTNAVMKEVRRDPDRLIA